MKRYELGTFEVKSPVLRISDPCYDKKTWCAGTVDNVLLGTWTAIALKRNFKSWGDRVCELQTVHEFFNRKDVEVKQLKIDVGVDSGCCGIFEDKLYQVDYDKEVAMIGYQEYNQRQIDYHEKEMRGLREATKYLAQLKGETYVEPPSYGRIAVLTHSKEWGEIASDPTFSDIGAGVIRGGVCARSGFGDGSYAAYAAYAPNGKVVGVKIVFIGKDSV